MTHLVGSGELYDPSDDEPVCRHPLDVLREITARNVANGGAIYELTIRQGYPHPIAYTWEADYHCPPCTARRFGVDPETGFVPEDARDSEGNPVGAVAPWDEWDEPGADYPQSLVCGTCGGLIAEATG